jgi:glutamate--cysteine ligase
MAAFEPSPQIRIGAEVEWLVFDRSDLAAAISADRVESIVGGPLPAGGTVTIEPGGQLELVTQPLNGPTALVEAVETDTATLARRFDTEGLTLVALGLDPVRPALRSLHRPRYDAMEAFFAAHSPAGLHMMTLTASLQLNLDFGPDPSTTWGLAGELAPVLSATFANSPTVDGTTHRPVSHRQQIWGATDPSRTRPVGGQPAAWADYVLGARVMMRSRAGGIEPQLTDATFGEALDDADPPTLADLDIHLTTLFPPIRPRGFLELRMLDAVPATGRAAAIATVWALLTDPDAGRPAAEACGSLVDPWALATEQGLEHPGVRAAAAILLDLATKSYETAAPALAEACRAWRRERIDPPAPVTPAGLSSTVADLIDQLSEHA